MREHLSRYTPSPAMIVAIIALVVATTGGAIAGGALLTGAGVKDNSLTGRDIKDGSVASADIKNKSVKRADLSAATVTSLRGQQGPAGPQGPPGPSSALHFESTDVLPWNDADQVVASLSLPAGNYVVFGKALAQNDSAIMDNVATVTCSLSLGGTAIDDANLLLGQGDRDYFPLSGRGTLAAAGSVTMTCNGGPTGSFQDRHIDAIRVGSLS